MIKKLLLPLILCLTLALPGYTSPTPQKAPVPGTGNTSSPKEQKQGLIVIRTDKDPKANQVKLGKDGIILVPQGGATNVKTPAGAGGALAATPGPSAAGGGAPAGAQGSEEAKDSEEPKKSKKSEESGQGISDLAGLDSKSDSGSLSSSTNDGGFLGGGAASGGGTAVPTSVTPEQGTTTAPSVTPSSTPSPTPTPAAVPPTLPATELQALLDQSVSDDGIPGAIVAVQTKWGSWIGAAGTADLDANAPMTTDMQVRLSGNTKLFTAALIMKLAEENKVSLDDVVDKWLPAQVWYGDQITIAMLLNHTSGIHDHETTPEFLDSLLWGPTIPWTPEDVLWITATYLPDFDPGTDFSFCNTGYYVLGMIAEAATGETVENLIQNRFFGPLNLTRTALTPGGMQTDPFSRGYSWIGTPEYPTLTDTTAWELSFDWTSGSGVSTAQDMLTWIKALFGDKKVVTSDSLTKMTTPQAPATTYGYGLEVVAADPWFGEKMYDNGSGNLGFYSRMIYYPDSGRTIFIALNRADMSDPPEVDAAQAADDLITGVTNLLISSGSQ